MKRICSILVIGFSLSGIVSSQEITDFYETGQSIVEADFTDFEEGPLVGGGVSIIGIFNDIPGNDTEVMEVEVPGGTTNSWDESLYYSFDTPENSSSITWRVQYRIRVQNAPYDVEMRLQINEDPWSGFTVTNTIPEKYKEKWLFFDYTAVPVTYFTTNQINFSLRFGAQNSQLLHLDDVKLSISNAFKIVGFESSTDIKTCRAIGADISRQEMENAPESFNVLKGVSTGEKSDIIFSAFPIRDYAGAYRLTLTMQSSVAPLTVKGGLASINDLSSYIIYAPDSQTITGKNQWQVLSFLIPAWTFGDKRLFAFVEFNKPGAEVLIDRVAMLKTDEKIEGPVGVADWMLQ